MSKIMDFIEKLPKHTTETVKECLGIDMIDRDYIRKVSVSLAARGILGMLPFAMEGLLPFAISPPRDECALRLLPEVPTWKSTVAICFHETTKARTIAPNSMDFVAGALAYSRVRSQILSDERKRDLIAFAEEWGNASNVKAILEIYSPGLYDEASLLNACDKNEYSEIFGELTSEDKTHLDEKLQRLMEKYPKNKALYSIYADRQIRFNKDVDVSETVWKMIKEDIACDSYIAMRTTATWIPMKHAIRWLIKQGNKSYTSEYPALYKAAKAWAEQDEYDGEAHLSFAKEIAETNPKLSYIQASNAAAIYASSMHKPPVEAIAFAKELAVKNQWVELSEVLGWAQEAYETK